MRSVLPITVQAILTVIDKQIFEELAGLSLDGRICSQAA
jgi:hypothetical protein